MTLIERWSYQMEHPGASVEEIEDSHFVVIAFRGPCRKSKAAFIKGGSVNGCLLGGTATLSGLDVR